MFHAAKGGPKIRESSEPWIWKLESSSFAAIRGFSVPSTVPVATIELVQDESLLSPNNLSWITRSLDMNMAPTEGGADAIERLPRALFFLFRTQPLSPLNRLSSACPACHRPLTPTHHRLWLCRPP